MNLKVCPVCGSPDIEKQEAHKLYPEAEQALLIVYHCKTGHVFLVKPELKQGSRD